MIKGVPNNGHDNRDHDHLDPDAFERRLRTVNYIRPNIDVEFGVIQYEIVRVSAAVRQIGWLVETALPRFDAGLQLLAASLTRQEETLERIAHSLELLTQAPGTTPSSTSPTGT